MDTYEKKYNEALKWMRELYPGLHGATKEDAEHFFPELRESEDERIRRELIEYLRGDLDDITTDDTDRWIAYLEKQKEYHIPWYDYQKSKEAGYTIVPNEEYEQLTKQKEQKPAEWSEEDEKMLSDLRNTLGCLMNAGAITFKTKKKFSNWLKSLRPSWKPNEEHLSALLAVFNDPNNIGSQTCQLALTDLYEQLKKL